MDNPYPPNFAVVWTRVLRIPRYAFDPLRQQAIDEYNVNISGLFMINDQTCHWLLSIIPSWLGWLSQQRWVSNNALKVITDRRMAYFKQTTGKPDTHIKERLLPADHEWAFWAEQTAWLKNAVETLQTQLPILQTYNANRRSERTPGTGFDT